MQRGARVKERIFFQRHALITSLDFDHFWPDRPIFSALSFGLSFSLGLTLPVLVCMVALISPERGVASNGEAKARSSWRGCEQALLDWGGALTLEEFHNHMAGLQAFIEGLKAGEGGKSVVVLSGPERLKDLPGPVVTFTTFSRELSPELSFRLATHVAGFVSALPRGRIVIASGGTMGNQSDPKSRGGGVGIVHQVATGLGYPVLSIVATKAFGYRPAPTDFLLVAPGNFGSESDTMLTHSDALVVIGGGNQAQAEALSYLNRNPNGILVLIEDPILAGAPGVC